MSRQPLWFRWVITVAVFAGLAAAVVIGLHAANGGSSETDAQAVVSANKVGRIAVAEDQAPHSAPLPAHFSPAIAVRRAITADVRSRVRDHQLTGPSQGVTCRPQRSLRHGRLRFHCSALAAGLSYPFYAVADVRTRQLVWCKQDAVSGVGLTVALSPRCLR